MTKKRKASNQELRTRKDLLLAASRIMKQGRKPTMDEVAAEALVSRATAYRYFQSIEALLVESTADHAVGNLEQMFAQNTSTDPEERVDEAEAALHRVIYENEAQLRIMLANNVGRDLTDESLPKRQNRRMPLIESALATARHRFRDDDYETLCHALGMIFGTESMIVFEDVLGVDEKAARQIKSWAVRALVRAALQSSKSRAKI